MKRSLRDAWVNALRSGDFKQTFGVLHDTKVDSYCCLGVLCKITPEVKSLGNSVYSTSETFDYAGDECTSFPHDKLILNGWQTNKDVISLLASRNDNGETFEEIAKIIEENVEVTED